jgi:hypothetical protein
VIVIALPLPCRPCRAFVNARQRDALGASTISAVEVHGGIVSRRYFTVMNGINLLESFVPIAMGIRVLSTEPAHQVSVIKIEADGPVLSSSASRCNSVDEQRGRYDRYAWSVEAVDTGSESTPVGLPSSPPGVAARATPGVVASSTFNVISDGGSSSDASSDASSPMGGLDSHKAWNWVDEANTSEGRKVLLTVGSGRSTCRGMLLQQLRATWILRGTHT